MVQWVPTSKTGQEVNRCIEILINKVKSRSYLVAKVVVDAGSEFRRLDETLAVPVDVSGSRTHAEHIEREIRLVKERLRANEAGLLFNLPKRLVKWEVYACVTAINSLRRRDDAVSPREAFTGIKFDVKRDLRAAFGDYAQVSVPTAPKNSPAPRTCGGICLGPTGNSKGT